jgi:hypothetical protein
VESARTVISGLVRSLAFVLYLALAGFLTFGTWSETVRMLRSLDSLVVDHGSGGRSSACSVIMTTSTSEEIRVGADRAGCDALRIGYRVHKEAWSLTYRTNHGTVWRRPAGEFWLGGVFGSLFTAVWLSLIVYSLVASWREVRRRSLSRRA